MNTGSHVRANVIFFSIIVVLIGVVFIMSSYFAEGAANQPSLASDVLRDFGILLASIGVISTFYEMLIRRELLADYNNLLEEILDPDSKKLGIAAIFRNRHDKSSRGRLPRSIISACRDELFGIGLGLYQFVPEQQTLIKYRIQEGCKFRFLIFDVSSQNIVALERSLGYQDGTLTDFIRNSTSFFINLKRDINHLGIGDKLEIRLYDIVPPWGLIGIDYQQPYGRILVEFNGFRVEGTQCPGVELVDTQDGWYKFFAEQMTALWDSAKPLIIPSKCQRAVLQGTPEK